jgi:hypothetical protein
MPGSVIPGTQNKHEQQSDHNARHYLQRSAFFFWTPCSLHLYHLYPLYRVTFAYRWHVRLGCERLGITELGTFRTEWHMVFVSSDFKRKNPIYFFQWDCVTDCLIHMPHRLIGFMLGLMNFQLSTYALSTWRWIQQEIDKFSEFCRSFIDKGKLKNWKGVTACGRRWLNNIISWRQTSLKFTHFISLKDSSLAWHYRRSQVASRGGGRYLFLNWTRGAAAGTVGDGVERLAGRRRRLEGLSKKSRQAHGRPLQCTGKPRSPSTASTIKIAQSTCVWPTLHRSLREAI